MLSTYFCTKITFLPNFILENTTYINNVTQILAKCLLDEEKY